MTGTEQVERSAKTLRALKQRFGFSAQVLADLTGRTLDEVRARLDGKTPMNVADLVDFGAVFKGQSDLLLMDENEALRWVIDNGIVLDDIERTHHRRGATQRQRTRGGPGLRGDASRWIRRSRSHPKVTHPKTRDRAA